MAGEDVWFHNFSYSSRYKVSNLQSLAQEDGQ